MQRGLLLSEKFIEGKSSFEHKEHPGNPFSALHPSEDLIIERLGLIDVKLGVEKDCKRKGLV